MKKLFQCFIFFSCLIYSCATSKHAYSPILPSSIEIAKLKKMLTGVGLRNSGPREINFYFSNDGKSSDKSYLLKSGEADDFKILTDSVFIIILNNQNGTNSLPYKTILKRGEFYHLVYSDETWQIQLAH